MLIDCRFDQPQLTAGLDWFNPPPHWQLNHGLELATGANTDLWQRTHYGFRRDDGHALLLTVNGDFEASIGVRFEPRQQYDQAGMLLRVDSDNWVKASCEYEDESLSRIGSVVTNLGYSDWATSDLPSSVRQLHYRLSRRGDDVKLDFSHDGQHWQQMRIAHLHLAPATVAVGPYACSPTGSDFRCTFDYFRVTENRWHCE